MTDDEFDQLISELLADESDCDQEDDSRYDRDALLEALNSNKEIRDDNHVDDTSILVWTEETNCLEAVPLIELPLRYPLQGTGARWSFEDLGKLLQAKATMFRTSIAAHELSEEHPELSPTCGTVVLIIPKRPGVFHWVETKANIAPELNR